MGKHLCICCGESLSETNSNRSRDPNLCASCSSLADGIEETCQVAGDARVLEDGGAEPAPGSPAPCGVPNLTKNLE